MENSLHQPPNWNRKQDNWHFFLSCDFLIAEVRQQRVMFIRSVKSELREERTQIRTESDDVLWFGEQVVFIQQDKHVRVSYWVVLEERQG